MKVFIAGATGVLGRRLIPELTRRGHRVVGLARSDAKAELVRSLGAAPARASLFDADALARVAEGADVVIHAATSIPVGFDARWRRAWEPNDRIRREGARALAAAAGAVGARRFLFQSVVWVVRTPPGGSYYDESTPPDPPVLLRSAVDGEAIADEAGARYGFGVGVLRGGSFYGPETAHSRTMAAMLRKRRMPVLGRGDFLVAPIHVEDAARAFAAAAESDRTGIWHVVDDEPVPFARLLERLAAALGAPPPRRVPLWLARLILGRDALEALTTSMHTSNAKLRRELGWTPLYPTSREGFARMVQAWREEDAGGAASAGQPDAAGRAPGPDPAR